MVLVVSNNWPDVCNLFKNRMDYCTSPHLSNILIDVVLLFFLRY